MMTTMQAAQNEVAAHARPHAAWIVRLARAGYAAKGIVYLVIGGLAIRAATGTGGGTADSRDALATIAQGTGGKALLVLMGIGLVGYALWAVLSAFLDAEDRGDEPKGIALRIAQAGRGLIYGALGVEALALVASASRRTGSGDGAEHWSARLLDVPWGRALLGAVGIGIMGYALYQGWRGARKNLQKRLRLGGQDPDVVRWVVRLARFGIIARGVVFLIVGWFITQAALRHDPQQAGGIGESLATIGAQPYGRLLLGIVAAGLIAYGVWQLANAKYREMRVG